MLQKMFALAFGEIRFEAEGGLTERFFNMCAEKNIILKKVEYLPTGFKAIIPYRSFKTVSECAKKNKCKLKILKKTGLSFWLYPYKHRYGIAVGACVFIALLALSQNVVWDIRFFECTKQQQEQLRHSLYEKGIYEGAIVSKKLLDKVKKELVIENTNYGWLTLNYIKGRIVVEKTNATPKPEFFGKEITNVVAAHDGIVRKIDVSGGFVQVCEGQSVAKGDILVSGTMNDSSGNLQKVHAQGKIFADVEKTYELTQSLNFSKQLPTSKRKSYYEIKFLNMNIPFFKNLPTPPESEQRLYRYPLVIFGFRFPATVYEYEIREQQRQDIKLTTDEAVLIAREKAYNAIVSDLPQVKILKQEEFIQDMGGSIKYVVKIQAEADIGKIIALTGSDNK